MSNRQNGVGARSDIGCIATDRFRGIERAKRIAHLIYLAVNLRNESRIDCIYFTNTRIGCAINHEPIDDEESTQADEQTHAKEYGFTFNPQEHTNAEVRFCSYTRKPAKKLLMSVKLRPRLRFFTRPAKNSATNMLGE